MDAEDALAYFASVRRGSSSAVPRNEVAEAAQTIGFSGGHSGAHADPAPPDRAAVGARPSSAYQAELDALAFFRVPTGDGAAAPALMAEAGHSAMAAATVATDEPVIVRAPTTHPPCSRADAENEALQFFGVQSGRAALQTTEREPGPRGVEAAPSPAIALDGAGPKAISSSGEWWYEMGLLQPPPKRRAVGRGGPTPGMNAVLVPERPAVGTMVPRESTDAGPVRPPVLAMPVSRLSAPVCAPTCVTTLDAGGLPMAVAGPVLPPPVERRVVALSDVPLSGDLRPSVALDGWVPQPAPTAASLMSLGMGRPRGSKAPDKRRLRVPTTGFANDAAREKACERVAVNELVRVLPECAIAHAVGGMRSWVQVGSAAELRDMAVELFSSKPGTEACNIKSAISNVHLLWEFGQERGLLDACFSPQVSMGLVALLVRREQARGAAEHHFTVGDRVRAAFFYMNDRLRLPVDTGMPKARHPIILAAAPPPTMRAPKHAASLPICVYAHMETLAASPLSSALRFFARSLVMLGLTMGIRVRDLLRSELLPPELRAACAREAGEDAGGDDPPEAPPEGSYSPLAVIRGRVALSKDGRPMDLFALAEGVLGPLRWVEEHFRDVAHYGQLLPRYECSKGSGGHIDAAHTMHPEVVSVGKLRDAWTRMLQLPPLALSAEQVREFGFRGHSIHGTLADLARFLGPQPGLGMPGFAYDDIRELGHWLRDANERVDAAVAARQATIDGRDAPAPGAPALQGAMPLRYSSGAGRHGECSRQIEVRARLVNRIRAALSRLPRGWTSLLAHVREVGSDWEILFPESVSLHALPRMLAAP